MPLADIVNVSISVSSVNVARAGFGVPLILSHSAAWVERTRTYNNLSAVAADFLTTSPEYLAAQTLFAQNPAPSRIMIGRAVNKPTQRWRLTVAQVLNNTAYRVYVNGVAALYTSDADATNDEIITGLNAAITALTTKPTPSTGGSAGSIYSVLTAASAGDWHRILVDNTALLTLEQDHADPGVAADLTAIKNESDAWYALVTLFNSKPYVQAAAAWVEANEKFYNVSTQDSTCENTAYANGSATDIASVLKVATYFRTAVSYHRDNGVFFDAGWDGVCLPMDPGSETWKFKTVATVPAMTFTATQLTNLTTKSANYYHTVAGVNITAEGTVASGEFIDVVRFRDWLKARLAERIFARLVTLKKVAYTDAGIAIIEAEIRAQLDEGIEVGGIASDPKPVVIVPKVSTASSADKTARRLTNVRFTCVLAGAIHSITINGTITL